MPLALRRIPNPPGTRPCCTMPYYPSPGVETELHSDSADTHFYLVEAGFVVGCYTDPGMAIKQVEGYRGSYRIKLPRYEDAVVQWEAMCAANHGFICPVAAAESQLLPPRALVSTAASSTRTLSFGAAQRKFIDAAVSGKPIPPLPGVQGTPTPTPAASKPASKPTRSAAEFNTAYASSWATSPGTFTSGGSSERSPSHVRIAPRCFGRGAQPEHLRQRHHWRGRSGHGGKLGQADILLVNSLVVVLSVPLRVPPGLLFSVVWLNGDFFLAK
ncbi:hypothetical protein C8F04DRAFT_1191584 [Mycena alexandri]|uniref:Uncharacterized protein n=1 Tax=Mycena alexandri TaxID=1745969 RepID=A0AAD6WY11_9AGAR|nr:hypothetical protein C8F04DRAFT_1191584 [Mycena alexandri]